MEQGIIQTFKLYYIRRTFKIILDTVKYNLNTNFTEYWRKFNIEKCMVNLKESLEELKQRTLKSCWKNLWLALTVKNGEEPVQVQTLAANIVEMANWIGREGFERIESSDIQELVESEDEDLTKTELEEMLNSWPIE